MASDPVRAWDRVATPHRLCWSLWKRANEKNGASGQRGGRAMQSRFPKLRASAKGWHTNENAHSVDGELGSEKPSTVKCAKTRAGIPPQSPELFPKRGCGLG